MCVCMGVEMGRWNGKDEAMSIATFPFHSLEHSEYRFPSIGYAISMHITFEYLWNSFA